MYRTVHSHACSINLTHILLPSEAGAAVITHTESGEARALWNDNVEPSATCSLLTSDHQAAQTDEHISLRLKRNVVALSQQGWLLQDNATRHPFTGSRGAQRGHRSFTMSCLDVMYPVYGHYAPHAPTAPAFINSFQAPVGLSSTSPLCRDFMNTPRGPEGVTGGSGPGVSTTSSSSSSSSSSYPPAAPRSEEGHKEKQEAPEAEYLTSRCVLFTYYQGDISSVVDEHFSRALSSYMDGEGKRRAPDQHGTDTPSPSSRRSFPPSFWDSSYSSPQSRSHCEPGAPAYSMDPYASGLHPGLPHPHPHPHHHAHPHSHPHPSESWGYPQTQAYGPPRGLHELYSSQALEPHYGPLLMPTVRAPHLPTLPGPYEVSKLEPTPSWPGLLPPGDVSQTLALNMEAGLQHHKKGKELYWF